MSFLNWLYAILLTSSTLSVKLQCTKSQRVYTLTYLLERAWCLWGFLLLLILLISDATDTDAV